MSGKNWRDDLITDVERLPTRLAGYSAKEKWEIATKFHKNGDRAGHLAALRILAREGDFRAWCYLGALPLKFLIDLVVRPGEWWTEREMRARTVPGTVFDVGPDGISTYYRLMQQAEENELKICVKSLTIFLAVFFSWHVWRLVVPDDNIQMILMLFPVAIYFIIFQHWYEGVGAAYRKRWQALERHGLEWHFQDDQWFRTTFRRNDGTHRIETVTRYLRLNREIAAVRMRRDELTKSRYRVLITLLKATIAFFTLFILISCTGYNDIFPNYEEYYIRIPLFVVSLILLYELPEPIATWRRVSKEKKVYESGAQYITAPRVFDPVHVPLALEDVKAQAAYGDASFVDPEAASKSLGG